MTIFSAGIGKNSKNEVLAKELIQFVKSPQAKHIIDDQGLEQIK